MKFWILPVAVITATLALYLSGPVGAEMVNYTIKDGGIAAPLTGNRGNPVKGLKTAIGRKKGNCLACHKMPVPDQLFHGEVGTDLRGAGDRYSQAQLRLRLVDSKKINPATSMPAFHRTTGLHRVPKQWKGKTILSAQEIEDVLAYLLTLRTKQSFAKAFKLNRDAGMKTFEWRKKIYSTSRRRADKSSSMKK